MKQAADVHSPPSRTRLFHAEVSLLPTEQGGRRLPIHSGYRASFTLPKHGAGDRVDGQLLFSGPDEIGPGQVGLVDIRPLVPEHWSSVAAGSDLPLWEGIRQIGVAHVR
jgi:hypothetical protein